MSGTVIFPLPARVTTLIFASGATPAKPGCSTKCPLAYQFKCLPAMPSRNQASRATVLEGPGKRPSQLCDRRPRHLGLHTAPAHRTALYGFFERPEQDDVHHLPVIETLQNERGE